MASPTLRSPPEQPGLSASDLHLLATLCSDISDAAGLPALIARLAPGLAPLIPFDQVALAMKAPDGLLWGLVRPRLAEGAEPAWIELADTDSPLEEAFREDRPVLRSGPSSHQLPAGMEGETAVTQVSLFPSAVCLPIHGAEGPLGALGIFSAAPGQYTMAQVHLLAILAPLVETNARKLLQLEEITRVEGEQKRADRLRRELLDQLSSELRSPLTVLYNGLDFLQSALLPPGASEAREQVDEMRLVAGTTLDMVENMVELAQIDDASLQLSPSLVALDALLRERAQLRAAAARIAEVQVQVRCDPPDATANLDVQLLSRVVDTLLVNALRHTPRRGQVALIAVVRPSLLTIAVADSGAPVPSSDRELLLERGPWEGDRRPPSRTYGLGFAGSAVTYLGGKLAIEAPPGAGNMFRISIPLEH
jgi:K+-sensing histidine kinase KdpD